MNAHNDVIPSVPAPDPARLARLRADLTRRADDADLLDVAVRTVDGPLGSLLVAVTPAGVVRVAFETEGHDDVLAALAADVSPRVLSSAARTDEVARQLDDYFAGRRHRFELPIDLQLVTGFRRDVIAHLPDVGYGETASYAELARLAGRPAAVRAVGSACANNPVPVVVPCHRIVRSDGTIGQYRGGTEAKSMLLAMEAA